MIPALLALLTQGGAAGAGAATAGGASAIPTMTEGMAIDPMQAASAGNQIAPSFRERVLSDMLSRGHGWNRTPTMGEKSGNLPRNAMAGLGALSGINIGRIFGRR